MCEKWVDLVDALSLKLVSKGSNFGRTLLCRLREFLMMDSLLGGVAWKEWKRFEIWCQQTTQGQK